MAGSNPSDNKIDEIASAATQPRKDKKDVVANLVSRRAITTICHCEPQRSNLISMKEKYYYVYIMTNKWNTTLYTGVTNDLAKRVWEHKQKLVKSFTTKYNINKLVHYEILTDIEEAIAREKQIKGGSRKNKIELIEKDNPKWRDLSDDL